jgi:hypothetical protein
MQIYTNDGWQNVKNLTDEHLYQVGHGDASCIGSPQCDNLAYLQGWNAFCEQAKSDFDRNIEAVIDQRNFWG